MHSYRPECLAFFPTTGKKKIIGIALTQISMDIVSNAKNSEEEHSHPNAMTLLRHRCFMFLQ